ncbi:MAG TPA: transcriptional repressor [Saprospiraceae bacterium]|nr:transcriptional repressor [Saprospiraceae bacterium]HPN67979.1 transcriptional repressor [Saprospiraceae bacterium]
MTEKVLKLLNQSDLRITAVRKDVLSVFLNADCAITTATIEAALHQIDRITLYRTLKSFEEKGLIHSINDGSHNTKYALCEGHCDEDHHHDEHVHFHCNACGNTFCIEESSVPTIALPSGYRVENASVIVNGICNKC